jgi:hypothetical protein
MTEQLIDIDTNDFSRDISPTIWDIENAEKLQFVSFIEKKIEEKFSKKFEYYEQLLLSLQEEHSNQILRLFKNLNETKSQLNETIQLLYEEQTQLTNALNELEYTKNELKSMNKIYIHANGKSAAALPNYCAGHLVYNKLDTSIQCDIIYPQFQDMPNLRELKLTGDWFEVNLNKDTLKFKLENITKLQIKWNHHGLYLKQDTYELRQDSTYRIDKLSYDTCLELNNLNMFPNLEHLIINLNHKHSRDVYNNTRAAQNIIEVIEYCPCKIKKITIIPEKNINSLFTGNLEPLKIFCSKNKIDYVIVKIM